MLIIKCGVKSSEFIRRFALHVLPKGFTKIRHYGFLSSTWKNSKLIELQESFEGFVLKIEEYVLEETILNKCRYCKKGKLVMIDVFGKRGPPVKYIRKYQIQHNKS